MTEFRSAKRRHEDRPGAGNGLTDMAYQKKPITRWCKIIGEDRPKGLLCQHRLCLGWTQHGLGVNLLTCQEPL